MKKRSKFVKEKPNYEKKKRKKRQLKLKNRNNKPRKIWSVLIFTYLEGSNQRFGRQRKNFDLLKFEFNTTLKNFTSRFVEAQDRVNHPSSTPSVASETSILELLPLM